VKLKKPLPKAAVLGGIVGAGLLVAVVGWFGLVAPQGKKAADLRTQTQAVEQQITDQLAQVAAAKNVTVAPKIRVADVYKLAKAMPSQTDMANIVLELNRVAGQAGVTLQSIAPTAPDPTGKILITLNVDGDFFTVTDLLYRLRNLVSVRHGALEATGRLFAVDTLSLTPGGSKLAASISLHTYRYVAAAPVSTVPATTPVTPATTDTTTTTTTPAPDTGAPSAAGAP
jgi:Pilus assembly protein, PilO